MLTYPRRGKQVLVRLILILILILLAVALPAGLTLSQMVPVAALAWTISPIPATAPSDAPSA